MLHETERNSSPQSSFHRALTEFLDAAPVILGLVLIIGPQLLFSSPEYRCEPRLWAFSICSLLAWRIFSKPLRPLGKLTMAAVVGLLIAHVASWIGGIQHGVSIGAASMQAVQGLIAVLGLAAMVTTFLEPKWRRLGKFLIVPLLVAILASSYFCYFLQIDQLIPMGRYPQFFEPTRLVFIWPLRIPFHWAGQIGWEHANHAAFVFAVAMVMIIEYLAVRKSSRSWPWWLLALFLGSAVFLTGSRSAWLMLLAAVPLVVYRRPKSFVIPTALVLCGALACGIASLKMKEALLVEAAGAAVGTNAVPAGVPKRDLHLEGLLERKSAGRVSAYQSFWEHFQDSKVFGRGLSATGKPIVQLMHEHSSFIATFRGGGFVALAAHILILVASIILASRLFSEGNRWPLALLVVVLPGLLFDRGNVFILSGRYEFLFHWIAVLTPLLIINFKYDLITTKTS